MRRHLSDGTKLIPFKKVEKIVSASVQSHVYMPESPWVNSDLKAVKVGLYGSPAIYLHISGVRFYYYFNRNQF
jgi:hypothetical protein